MSGILKVVGVIMIVSASIYGFILCFSIVESVLGSVWAYISLIFAPFVLGIAPWYALFSYGDYVPLLVTYGGIIPGGAMFFIAEKFEK